MRKYISLTIAIITVLFLFSGCTNITTISTEYNQSDYFVFATEKIPETLSPTEYISLRENDIVCSLFEGLVEKSDNGEIVPALAKGWKISEDRLEYTFELLDDIKWSDGEPITSFDFIDYFKSILAPGKQTSLKNNLDVIYGVEPYRNGKDTFENVAIKALDNKTIVIRLNQQDEELLNKLAQPECRLRNVKDNLSDYENQFMSIRYSGPYYITSIGEDGSLILEKNKNYIGDSRGLSKIKIKEKQGDDSAFADYNIGNIDILLNPPITVLREGNLYKSLEVYPTSNTKTLLFNTENTVIDLYDFRKAMFDALSIGLYDNYLISNNISTLSVKALEYDGLLNETLEKGNIKTTVNVDEIESSKKEQNITSFLSKLDLRERSINMVSLDTKENRIICEFIGKLLKEKYGINNRTRLYNEEDLAKVLKDNKFDIYISDIDINLNETNKKFLEEKENIFNKEMSIISLCNRNDIFCKSDRIKYVFIDGNGNILFKYIEAME